jgi:hypothetical protein
VKKVADKKSAIEWINHYTQNNLHDHVAAELAVEWLESIPCLHRTVTLGVKWQTEKE